MKLDPKRVESLVKCGKEASLKELFDVFYGRVYATVIVMVKNRDQAEDITQEAFIRAFLKLKSLREPAKFGAWVATIAANMARDSIKKEKKYVLTEDPEEDTSIAKYLGIEEEVIRKDDKKRFLKVLRSLSPAHYQVIMLFYYHDRTIEDIAQLLEIEEGTVKSRLHRAREKLKKILPEMEQKTHKNSQNNKQENESEVGKNE